MENNKDKDWERFSDLLTQMIIPEKMRNSNHDIAIEG